MTDINFKIVVITKKGREMAGWGLNYALNVPILEKELYGISISTLNKTGRLIDALLSIFLVTNYKIFKNFRGRFQVFFKQELVLNTITWFSFHLILLNFLFCKFPRIIVPILYTRIHTHNNKSDSDARGFFAVFHVVWGIEPIAFVCWKTNLNIRNSKLPFAKKGTGSFLIYKK